MRTPLLSAILLAVTSSQLIAQAEKPKPPEPPKIESATTLGIPVAKSTKLTLRGQKLDAATEARCQAPTGRVKLLDKKKDGDKSSAEIEITLPNDYPGSTVTVSLASAAG